MMPYNFYGCIFLGIQFKSKRLRENKKTFLQDFLTKDSYFDNFLNGQTPVA